MADDQMNTFVREPFFPEGKKDHEMNEINTEYLRNASPLPESDSEYESEMELEPIEEHPGPHLSIVHQPTAWQMTQQVGFQAFIWLQFIWSVLQVVTQKGMVVGKSVVRSLQPKHYVFFQGSHYPYRAQDYTLAGPGVAPVEWYYDADKKLFISSQLYNTTTEFDTHHLEWLCAEIKYNDLTLYDITEYIEQVKYAGSTKPSASRVLAAWSIESGIVLNAKDGVTLHTLNEDGSESQLTLRS